MGENKWVHSQDAGHHRVVFAAGMVFGLIAGLLGACLLVADVKVNLDAVTRVITAAAVTLGGIVGSLALLYARGQLLNARRNARIDRTAALARRFNSTEMAWHIMRTRQLVGVPSEPERDAAWDKYRKDPQTRIDIVTIWNFFEELGMKYNRGLVDHELVGSYIGYSTHELYELLGWVIDRQRALRPAWEGPQEWEEMNRQLKQGTV